MSLQPGDFEIRQCGFVLVEGKTYSSIGACFLAARDRWDDAPITVDLHGTGERAAVEIVEASIAASDVTISDPRITWNVALARNGTRALLLMIFSARAERFKKPVILLPVWGRK